MKTENVKKFNIFFYLIIPCLIYILIKQYIDSMMILFIQVYSTRIIFDITPWELPSSNTFHQTFCMTRNTLLWCEPTPMTWDYITVRFLENQPSYQHKLNEIQKNTQYIKYNYCTKKKPQFTNTTQKIFHIDRQGIAPQPFLTPLFHVSRKQTSSAMIVIVIGDTRPVRMANASFETCAPVFGDLRAASP